jgi:hypothetical protein
VSSEPKVTVLMPVHNGDKFLREAIDSILSQTYTDFEFLMIDDGSTDDSWNILNSYHDERIRLIRNPTNLKIAATLNRGIDLARGEYIARMDADDISRPTRLETQVSFLEAHPEVSCLGGAVQIIDECGRPLQIMRPPAEHHHAIRWSLCFCSPFAHPTVMMRREAVTRVGGYNTDFTTAQDRDLWRRLSAVTCLANLAEILLNLRMHQTNISVTHRMEQKRNAATSGQHMMAELLGQVVPFDICLGIELGKFGKVDDACQAAGLIYRLYQVFMSDPGVSRVEKRAIRCDAGRQLFVVARPWLHDSHVWQFFILACRLNPLFVSRSAASKAGRLARQGFPASSEGKSRYGSDSL